MNQIPAAEVEAAPVPTNGNPWPDDNPFDPYDLAEEPAPAPAPRRRVVAVAPAPGEAVAATPPPYRVRAAAADDDDDKLPLEPTEPRTWRDFTYLVLLLAMLPLVFSSFKSDRGDIEDLVRQSVQAHPELADKLKEVPDEADLEEIIAVFPGHKLEGALLARDSWTHWVFGAGSAVLFLTIMVFLFNPGCAKPKSLLLTGFFTGTVGILLLLGFQFVAEWTQGMWVRGRGIIVLLFYVVKFIGFSYGAADDPTNGFAASFFGYTFGVGLCEEVCKALPLVLLVQNLPERATWRTACLWGLASGVGFGVAEGIIYSARYYNGIGGGDIYLVRFLSCVALHATWAAAVAILLYKMRAHITGEEGMGGMLWTTAIIAMPSIVLHGLYDTLLKKDHSLIALGVAIGSFVYLAGLIEWSMRKGDKADEPHTMGYQLPGRHTVR